LASLFFVWVVHAYSLVTSKSHIEDVKVKAPLESKVCIGHDAKKMNSKF